MNNKETTKTKTKVTFTCGICGMTHRDTEENMHELWTPLVWVMDGDKEVKSIDEPICPVCSSVCNFPDDDGEMTIQEELYNRLKDSYVIPLSYNQKQVQKVIDCQAGSAHAPTMIVKSANGTASNELNISEDILEEIYHLVKA
jgi:hypothetical protein